MGSGRFNAAEYAAFSASTVGKTTEEIYSSTSIHASLNPFGVKVRESRDSADNPESTPIIVALDVTGSMGMLADNIAREGLGTLFTSILERKPVSDPHIMFMGIGRRQLRPCPLQASQFEADTRIIDQLKNLWIEHGGGDNTFESYNLPWYFAAYHTEIDSLEKRAKRGYLFTVGDEQVPGPLTAEQIKTFLGDDVQGDQSTEELLELAQRKYDVFHVIIEEGSHARTYPREVKDSWTKLMGQRVISLSNHHALAETIVSAIEMAEGRDLATATSGWAHASVVRAAVAHVPPARHAGMLAGPR